MRGKGETVSGIARYPDSYLLSRAAKKKMAKREAEEMADPAADQQLIAIPMAGVVRGQEKRGSDFHA
jgi:hypothetical protein